MNTENVLSDLDKHAAEFNFPVLDNAYIQMAGVRLSAFRSGTDWSIAFEVLGYSINEGAYVNDLYGYGSCLRREGVLESSVTLLPNPEQPLIDPQTEAWIADWSDWSVVVGDRIYRFTPARADYLAVGIEVSESSGAGSLGEAELIRFFIAQEGADKLFMAEEALRESLAGCGGLNLFLQTQDWQHPDVAGEEKPSMNPSLRSLVAALASGSPALFQPGKVNTSWRSWDLPIDD
jgi:hypothetical protein